MSTFQCREFCPDQAAVVEYDPSGDQSAGTPLFYKKFWTKYFCHIDFLILGAILWLHLGVGTNESVWGELSLPSHMNEVRVLGKAGLM